MQIYTHASLIAEKEPILHPEMYWRENDSVPQIKRQYTLWQFPEANFVVIIRFSKGFLKASNSFFKPVCEILNFYLFLQTNSSWYYADVFLQGIFIILIIIIIINFISVSKRLANHR